MLVPVPGTRGTGPLIAVLTLVFLGAIAWAIPRARLVPAVVDVERGLLVSHSRLSDQLAEQVNTDGYNYLAVDLTHAPADDDALWSEAFDRVARIFPVWGWVDARRAPARVREIEVPLQALFLYGATPPQVATARESNPGLRVIPVVPAGRAWTGEGEYGAVVAADAFPGGAPGGALPVLRAAELDLATLRSLRARAEGSYLVASIVLRP